MPECHIFYGSIFILQFYNIANAKRAKNSIRIQFRAVAGKKEKADVILFNPTFDLLRVMDRMAVNNEKYFALALARQTSEKLQKDLRYR